MPPPQSHKEVVKYLQGIMVGKPRVSIYRDNEGRRPVPIGRFGDLRQPFYSTIGLFDTQPIVGDHSYELAAYVALEWLPNAVASSVYWFGERDICEFPIVCEDAVKQNARSTYRHMVYVPSIASLKVSTGQEVRWLLGLPVSDSDIAISIDDATDRVRSKYPKWVFA